MQSLLDERLLDLSLAPGFFSQFLQRGLNIGVADLHFVHGMLARTLYRLERICDKMVFWTQLVILCRSLSNILKSSPDCLSPIHHSLQ